MAISISTNTSDEELMQEAQTGNRYAFEMLYDRYAGNLNAYFYRMLRQDKEVAEDYTQEIFMKIIQSKSSYDPKRKFKTWIFSIAHNMCKNNYRKDEVKKRAAMELKATHTHKVASNDKGYDQAIFKQELEKALLKLNNAKRSCFIMRFKQDLSIKEIAAIEAVSEGTIKSRIFYALKELTSTLKEFNPKLTHDTLR